MKIRRRGIRFQPKKLETGRKYMWRKEFLPLLYNYLELSRDMTVLDVGCGTGFFSRLISDGMGKTGRVIGVDRNPKLISAARSIAKSERFSSKVISFRQGQAEELPFKNNFVDRVVCQTLLWIVKDSRRVLEEMVRVCKTGGLVAALDWGYDSIIHYFPAEEDQKLSKLYKAASQAEILGYRKLYGNDRTIAYKLPTIFKQLGLERVRLDSYAHSYLGSDDRISLDYKMWYHKTVREEYEKILRSLSTERKTQRNQPNEDVRILRLGGMPVKQITRLYELGLERSKRLLAGHELLANDTSMDAGILLIVTGLKPNKKN